MQHMHERRRWVRFVLPEVMTRLTWTVGGATEAHLGSLVDGSSSGVAMILDVEPPGDQAFLVYLDDGKAATGPIPSRLVSLEQMPSGRTLAKFRFDSVHGQGELIRHQSERRAWRRVVPKEKRASLSWHSADQKVTVPGLLRNIGGGGAAVQTETAPLPHGSIWLRVGADGQETEPVECKVLSCQSASTGIHLVRLSFVGMCPLQLYRVAMGQGGGPV